MTRGPIPALKLAVAQKRSPELGGGGICLRVVLSVLRSEIRGFWDTFTKSVLGVVACKPGARMGLQIGTDSTISRRSWTSARSDLGDSTLGCAQPLGRPPGSPGWPQNRPRPARGFRERFLCLPGGQQMLRHNCRLQSIALSSEYATDTCSKNKKHWDQLIIRAF